VGSPTTGGWQDPMPVFHTSLVIFVKGKNRLDVLKKFCADVIAANELKKDKLYYYIYRFNVKNLYWQQVAKKIVRDINSIILPSKMIERLTEDIERFLDPKTIRWYFEHGIPYKRSYLFYGVPGSGKSSLIQAIAGKYERNLCFLQPTHPNMTDDAFKTCIQTAPANSLIVLEDIDALFNKDRSKKHQQCPLTFSGLLNGLDGVGNPDGQIFILTTNFVERLDDALIRSGRVDLHIEFPMSTDEQLTNMFLLFFPLHKDLAKQFCDSIKKHFPQGISMAAVQQHFISNMFKEPKEIVAAVADLGNRLDVVQQLNAQTILKEKPETFATKSDLVTKLETIIPEKIRKLQAFEKLIESIPDKLDK